MQKLSICAKFCVNTWLFLPETIEEEGKSNEQGLTTVKRVRMFTICKKRKKIFNRCKNVYEWLAEKALKTKIYDIYVYKRLFAFCLLCIYAPGSKDIARTHN